MNNILRRFPVVDAVRMTLKPEPLSSHVEDQKLRVKIATWIFQINQAQQSLGTQMSEDMFDGALEAHFNEKH